MIGRGEEFGEASLEQDAASWAVRLSGDDVAEDAWLAFVAWLDDAPLERPDLHRQAFDRAQAVWLSLEPLHERQPASRRARPPATPSRRPKIVGLAQVAAAACVTMLGLWLVSHSHPGGRPQSSALVAYATSAGQQRTLRLADGSRIDMDGATALTVDVQGADRRVVFALGEARFDVVHDPGRPFRVDLGRAQVRVLGTAFDIVREDGLTRVGVARGLVSFDAGGQIVRLPAGHSAVLGAGDTIKVAQISPPDVGVWREGRRVYRDRPLSDVVADLNREYPRPIRLAGLQAQRMRFTGILVLGTRDQVIRRLQTLLPLSVEKGQEGEIVLSARRP